MAVKVILAGREYNYAFNLGALMHFERIMAQLGDNVGDTASSAVMHYSCLLGDKNFTLSVDDFYAAVDTVAVLTMLNDALVAERKRWDSLNGIVVGDKDKRQSSKKK